MRGLIFRETLRTSCIAFFESLPWRNRHRFHSTRVYLCPLRALKQSLPHRALNPAASQAMAHLSEASETPSQIAENSRSSSSSSNNDDNNNNNNNNNAASKFQQKNACTAANFQLKNSCVLTLQRGDITTWSIDGQTDAIVNAANTRMLGGGGVDGAIHRAAGPDLYKVCVQLPLVGQNVRCQTGDAVITDGFRLPVAKIVHTVGPIYDDDQSSGPLLESSYKRSIQVALRNGIKYIAFPAISCGVYGYPYDKAAEIALDTVNENSDGLEQVHFVLFEEGSWKEWISKAERSFTKLED